MFNHNSKPGFGEGTYAEIIGEHLLSKLDSYAIEGRTHGGFLTAVLEGDLFKAVEHGEDRNVLLLKPICKYIWNQMPSTCYGSKERVDSWVRSGGLKGQGYTQHDNGSWLKTTTTRLRP